MSVAFQKKSANNLNQKLAKKCWIPIKTINTSYVFQIQQGHIIDLYQKAQRCMYIFAVPDKKHLKNVGPIRHCEPPHAACSNYTLPFTRCRYYRHHYQDEPKPAIAIAQAVCDSSDTWWMAM